MTIVLTEMEVVALQVIGFGFVGAAAAAALLEFFLYILNRWKAKK